MQAISDTCSGQLKENCSPIKFDRQVKGVSSAVELATFQYDFLKELTLAALEFR